MVTPAAKLHILSETMPVNVLLERVGALTTGTWYHLLSLDKSCWNLASDWYEAELGHKMHADSDNIRDAFVLLGKVVRVSMALDERGKLFMMVYRREKRAKWVVHAFPPKLKVNTEPLFRHPVISPLPLP